MSGAGDDRSQRGGRRGNDPPGLQRQNTGPRDVNASIQQGRRGGGARGQNQPRQPSESIANGPAQISRVEAKRAEPAPAAPQDEHVPVNEFNAQEVKEGLKAISEPKPAIYKPTEKVQNTRAAGPWGSKPNMTANGKDFFLELRKQMTALQHGGGMTLGG